MPSVKFDYMATYKKRGYKPKTKKEKEEVVEENSTTAEVFNTLDESASKTEEWVVKNQNYIVGVIGLIAAVVLGYMAYGKYIAEPKAQDAMNDMYPAQKYYKDAQINTVSSDSLYTLAINGGDGKYGFKDIINTYGGTPAANLANYYAGIASLNLKDYKSAIEYLGNFSSDDKVLSAVAFGAIGDAFAQLDQKEEALPYYEKAANANKNDFNTPYFLMKAALISISLNDNGKALEFLTTIKEDYPDSDEGKKVDPFIGRVEAAL